MVAIVMLVFGAHDNDGLCCQCATATAMILIFMVCHNVLDHQTVALCPTASMYQLVLAYLKYCVSKSQSKQQLPEMLTYFQYCICVHPYEAPYACIFMHIATCSTKACMYVAHTLQTKYAHAQTEHEHSMKPAQMQQGKGASKCEDLPHSFNFMNEHRSHIPNEGIPNVTPTSTHMKPYLPAHLLSRATCAEPLGSE